MKILHVFKTYLPDNFGGVERVIWEIAEGAARQGFASDVFTLSKTPSAEPITISNHRVHQASATLDIASTPIAFTAATRFRNLAQAADLIHYHFPWPMMDLWHLHAGGRGRPSVVTYHSDVVKQTALLRLYQPLMNRFLGSVDHIVATSPQYLATSPVLSRFSGKTSVIPLGINPFCAAKPANCAAISSFSGLPDRFFLFVGAPRYYKGLPFLFEAARQTGLPVVIAGGTPEGHQVSENVTLLGPVSDEEKAALLSRAEAFVFPSHLRSEAFGIALLEAAFAGKPLISCEIGTGTSYVNRDGQTGLVVPPADPQALGDAMLTLWNNEALRARLGAAARRRAMTHFQADQMVDAYCDLYRKLLNIPAEPQKHHPSQPQSYQQVRHG
ncbi:glycosyltransferase [Tianweitania populi]|uniref:Glycosyl transferase family 1 n=1 Tax=Tianweitania populi TaxID=1607949 RepID=A0A8J3DWI1_9HYPH|nr:glycosyltransferase [Tianweitania populi]GHD12786.1 glycosyl transferase family 1 [Tianweitania populi]